MKVVYFGSFDEHVSPRVRLIREGLCANGVEVVECRAGGSALPRWSRLARALPAAARGADLLLVGKPGQREMPLAWTFARALGIPLALDLFASLWINEVHERRRVAAGTLAAKKLRALDRFALQRADLCLVDTVAHGQLIASTLAPGRRVAPQRRVFVGAEACFTPLPRVRRSGLLEALFVGTFIPFHGIDVILRAAALLRDEPRLRITLLGDGQERGAMERLAAELALQNVRFEPSIDYAALPARLARADLALGLFGATPTAAAVIPKKVFAALAAMKPVITADGDGPREALDDSTAYLCAPGDPEALAETLRRALDDGPRRDEVAARGRALHERRFTAAATGAACREALADLLARSRATVVPTATVP
ncbi:MAG: glycosyltransferase [Planctomycetes bacterium]|nr:glycosyltransferase [Planctomycetota bacterium]